MRLDMDGAITGQNSQRTCDVICELTSSLLPSPNRRSTCSICASKVVDNQFEISTKTRKAKKGISYNRQVVNVVGGNAIHTSYSVMSKHTYFCVNVSNMKIVPALIRYLCRPALLLVLTKSLLPLVCLGCSHGRPSTVGSRR